MSQDNLIRLQCDACQSYNYFTRRNLKRTDSKKLERNKFCRHCRQHTLHKERAKK